VAVSNTKIQIIIFASRHAQQIQTCFWERILMKTAICQKLLDILLGIFQWTQKVFKRFSSSWNLVRLWSTVTEEPFKFGAWSTKMAEWQAFWQPFWISVTLYKQLLIMLPRLFKSTNAGLFMTYQW